jgi:prepilin-type N-terminal cleavage/methylation domain-containing protein
MSRRASSAAGFTLPELLMAVAILGTIAAIAIPMGLSMTDRMRLNQGLREVEREMQTARLKAVSLNKSLQVRFNCPAADQYRIVEVMNSAVDNTANRCNPVTYPPRTGRDADPATPDFDGPVRYLTNQVHFPAGTTVFQFAPTGQTVQVVGTGRQMIPGTGVDFTLTKGTLTGTVNVNGLGRIRIQ